MVLFNICIQFLVLLHLIVAAPTVNKPSEDPFYSAPEGFENAKLGEILKHRNTPAPIRSIIFEVDLKDSWQLLVRSQDSFGNPSVIVTTVFQPHNADSSKLVSFQVAQDSANIDCSPSYSFMNGGGPKTINNQAETFLMQTALNEGYYVVSPDYEGLNAVFTGGIQAGHGVLDSLRAVLNSKNTTGIDPSADTVIWGYSGGSLASGWASALQPTYAAELAPNLKGAALGGWVTNITATVTNVNGGVFAGLGAAGIAGLSNGYPELHDYFKTAMYADKYEKFTAAYDQCLVEDIGMFAFDNYFEGDDRYFKDGISVLNQEPAKEIIANNTLGLIPEQIPEIPLFIYHGNIDNIVPYDQAVRVYDIWCEAGIGSMEFAADLTAGHITEIVQGSGAAFAWVKKILSGENPVSGCEKTERLTNVLYPGSVGAITSFLSALVTNLLGTNIGPNGENLTLVGNSLLSMDNVTDN